LDFKGLQCIIGVCLIRNAHAPLETQSLRTEVTLKLVCIVYEEAILNSRRTPFAFIRKTSVLLLFMEIVAGYCESYRPEITVHRKDAGFLYILAGGAYIYH
jgi:hypothetical protein